jgi:hypothetical protein
MVSVTTEGEHAVFEVEGVDKLWALRSRLRIPLAHITSVVANAEQVGRWWHGFKVLGTDVPGLLGAGTFYYHGEMVFWDVHNPSNAIILSLDHERYKKLIIEVDDPPATIARLNASRAQLRPS